ncbi:hypothetical protein BDQ17DRAFT_231025 [Cyathus striatus]|nr:hypothetical protein BDQ17DRAFT_231025 [Cyathus striatus]
MLLVVVLSGFLIQAVLGQTSNAVCLPYYQWVSFIHFIFKTFNRALTPRPSIPRIKALARWRPLCWAICNNNGVIPAILPSQPFLINFILAF